MIRRPPRSTLFPLHDALPIYIDEVPIRGIPALPAPGGRRLAHRPTAREQCPPEGLGGAPRQPARPREIGHKTPVSSPCHPPAPRPLPHKAAGPAPRQKPTLADRER